MRRLVTWASGGAFLLLIATGAEGAGQDRTFVAGKFALELDGKGVGFLRSVDGGLERAAVVTYQDGSSPYVFKQLGPRTIDDFALQMDVLVSPAVGEWIGQTLDGRGARRDGAIVSADFDLKTMSTRKFTDALLTEIGFPACDAAAKDPAYMTLKFAPEDVQYVPGDGSTLSSQVEVSHQKTWNPANFRIKLGDLPSARVSKIDAFSIKQKLVEFRSGDGAAVQRVPGKIEYPNLTFYIPPIDSKPWMDWYEHFVVGGHDGQGEELAGSLAFLDAQGAEVVQIELSQVGIFALAILPPEPGDKTDGPAAFHRVKVELYVEAMRFKYLGGGGK